MDEEDEFGADENFLAALAASEASLEIQTTAPRITQPSPQPHDRPLPRKTSSAPAAIVQPVPQFLTSRSTTSSILVSPRQKGNPLLSNLRSYAWEYADILSDYDLGQTTCALFLSLKYHRLHPEYIYNRIKGLQGKYNLRVLLTLVDITNHEDCLKELAKTSLVNNVTVILCWSTVEAARYLELYKSYEHSPKDNAGIKGIEKKGYAEKMVEFITVPRGINKTDAVSIVSAFGSIRGAVNARQEEIAIIGGWGEKKVRRWCSVMDEPFTVRKITKRSQEIFGIIPPGSSDPTSVDDISRSQRGTDYVRLDHESRIEKKKDLAVPTETMENFELPFLQTEGEEEAKEVENSAKENKIIREKEGRQDQECEEFSSGLIDALAKLRENR